MTAANPQRKNLRPANPRPQPTRRNAAVIAFDFVRKQRIAFDYDVSGNPISVTDNLGRTTLTTYDALNRPVRIVGPSYTDATYGLIRPVTKYVYDNLGNLTQVLAGRTDSSGTNIATDVTAPQTTIAYDDFGRKLKETDPLGKFWSYTYDKNNNLTKATDAKGQITQYTWGYGHQLIARTDAANSTTGYARNALGQVLVAQTPIVTTRYAYDPAHRLASITDSRGWPASPTAEATKS